jgi:predicted ArsR family transcriptional regulator
VPTGSWSKSCAASPAARRTTNSRSEIAKGIRLTSRATRTRLARLVERGLVREVGTSPQDPKRRYFRAD